MEYEGLGFRALGSEELIPIAVVYRAYKIL